MRTNGVSEKYCTGNASDWEKFEKWAETIPYTLRNPLYHWSHLELKRYFDINDLLNPKTAQNIYHTASEMLQKPGFRVNELLIRQNVELVCTTDDPVDSLEYHQAIQKSNSKVKVLPAWRPDKAMMIDDFLTYNRYIDQLEIASGMSITQYHHLIEALRKRHQYFHENNCCISDHGIDTIYAETYSENEIIATFRRVRSGTPVDPDEVLKFKSAMLHEFALMDAEKGWVQQFHIGAMRNNNIRMFKQLGPDIGFDSIGDKPIAEAMLRFFARLDKQCKLTKTIIYNLNPADNELYATMLGNFQDGTVAGKMQWGAGWWFLNQKEGMEKHLNTLSSLGLLSRFVGMLTDSRSFLSYPRHEYFRRILCNLLGNDMEKGEIPNDMPLIGQMVQDICYHNAKKYFGV
jgi:glucuronate isomerase